MMGWFKTPATLSQTRLHFRLFGPTSTDEQVMEMNVSRGEYSERLTLTPQSSDKELFARIESAVGTPAPP